MSRSWGSPFEVPTKINQERLKLQRFLFRTAVMFSITIMVAFHGVAQSCTKSVLERSWYAGFQVRTQSSSSARIAFRV
jgi:hypothetical protein